MRLKEKEDCELHRKTFATEIEVGPIYPCVCCIRDLFRRGVQNVSTKFKEFLKEESLYKYIDLSLMYDGMNFICHNCKANLRKKTMPPLCFMNGLQACKIPPCLSELKGLEKQLIKKSLPFIKVRQLAKTQMDIMNDKVVSVPISDEDVVKNVTSLPRTKETNGILNLKMKRRMKYKTYYKVETARPEMIYNALIYLKDHNPFYKSVKILPYADFVEDCKEKEEDEHEAKTSESDSEPEANIDIDETDNLFNTVTCLLPEDISTEVIVNSSKHSLKKKLSRKSSTIYELAPGENKIPTNWTREKNIEETMFPNLFPDGQNGCDTPREKKLTPHQYYCQKMMDHSGIYAEEEDFLFIGQQKCEILAVERQIDVSMKQGKVIRSDDGNKLVKSSDAFSIFKNIPGTPSYWKAFRNEILARMEQFGPFHMFFTLSCAEAKWNHVLASVLQKDGKDVTIKSDDNQESVSYFVNGMPLEEYRQKFIKSMTNLLKKHYVLITRMFDNQVKAFMKNILLKHQVSYYSYRIEFQARGYIF